MQDHSGLSRRNDAERDRQNSRLSSKLPTDTGEASGLSSQGEQGSTQANGQGPTPELAAQEVWEVRKGAGVTWTAEKDAILRHMRSDGCSFSTIANILGKTRSACIGRAHRLNLDIVDRKIKAKVSIAPPKRNREGNITEKVKRAVNRKLDFKGSKPPQIFKERPVSSDFLSIGFFDLQPGMCRYPKGDGLAAVYCGQPVKPDTSYCPHCFKITHATAKQISDETRAKWAAHTRREFRIFPREGEAA